MLIKPGSPWVSFVISKTGVAASVPTPAIGQIFGDVGLSVLVRPDTIFGLQARIMPIWIVIALHAEIGAANNFEIVGQAWMTDREVFLREIGFLGQAVDEWSVGIVHDLAVAVVLHHDQKHMVELRHPLRSRPLVGQSNP